MKLPDFPEAQALSPQEKLQLVDELWISVSRELDDPELTEEEKRLLDDRWSSYLRSPDSALTLEHLKAKLVAARK